MATDKKKKVLLISIGTLVTGIAAYFGWRIYNKSKQNPDLIQDTFITPKSEVYRNTVSTPVRITKTVPATKKTLAPLDDFPLKKGSKGEKVKTLQQALIDKHGKSILPKAGADGDFGSEMTAALKKLGLSETVDETTYNILIKGKTIDPAKMADTLYNGARNKDFNKTLDTLKQMKSVNDYQIVNNIFKTDYFFDLTRKTLVTGVLDSFENDDQKDKIRQQFQRMGLKYNGDKWSLSGSPENMPSLLTTENCTVYDKNRKALQLSANTVLGKLITEKNGFMLFENAGQNFLVASKSVRLI